MEQIATLAVGELREELNEDVSKEPSRLVRIIHLKYKCFVILVLTVLVSLLICYTALKDVLRDQKAGLIIMETFQLISKIYFPNSTVDLQSVLEEIKNR